MRSSTAAERKTKGGGAALFMLNNSDGKTACASTERCCVRVVHTPYSLSRDPPTVTPRLSLFDKFHTRPVRVVDRFEEIANYSGSRADGKFHVITALRLNDANGIAVSREGNKGGIKERRDRRGYHDSLLLLFLPRILYPTPSRIRANRSVRVGDPDVIKTHSKRQVPRDSATVTTWQAMV